MQTSRITATAPCRISLFGGGSDVEPFASHYGGKVINFAINYYTKVTIDPLFNFKVERPSIGGGLGGSASMMVATYGALYKYLGVDPNLKSQAQVAKDAFEKEKEFGITGCQDHYTSALGGFNYLEIGEEVKVTRLSPLALEGFLPWLVLFDLGLEHRSYEIQKGFENPDPRQIEALQQMTEIVPEALNGFKEHNYEYLGELLDNTWELKKISNNVSNDKINDIYEAGMRHGAIGGKLIGAGQGGYFLFVVEPNNRQEFIECMELKEVPFKVDYGGLCVR